MPIVKNILQMLDPAGNKIEGADATTLGSVFRFDMRSASLAAVQLTLRSTSGAGARSIWAVTQSLDGVNFAAFSTAISLTTINGTVMVTGIDVSTVWAIQITPTTVSTYTTELVDITVLRADWT